MARLYLKFEQHVIREVVLSGGVVTIGRQPDNLVAIDNPAVSGHHARVSCEDGRYILEDLESFNGTYVNNNRVAKVALADGDVVVIGKHTLLFRAQAGEEVAAQPKLADRSLTLQSRVDQARVPQLEHTVILDTRRAKEMLAQAAAAAGASAGRASGGATAGTFDTAPVKRTRFGTLTILAGKTDRRHYTLSSKLSAIGRSKLATIRLKKWFAPGIAASIQLREDHYFIVAAGKKNRIKVNGNDMNVSQQEIKPGDVIQIAGIEARFDYE